ncbi:MAG: restriction endonuclease subunit S [Ectothiorhodospiraceae bacterium AqS1]|nr:restriction endonuclease subunit S [Ectothiorhodospiraceae bacterium AqS1]
MNKWREVKLGDIADIGTGKTNRQDETKNGLYPLFDRSSVIKRSDKYLFDCKAVIIPGEGKEFLPRYFSGKFDLHQRAYRITSKSENSAQTKFLYYYLNQHRSYWERVAVGTTVKSLRLHSFVDFPVKLPPIEEQKAIVRVLGILDDKIELNQQMNETLESMAQAIFQDWFIDFGPTRRKMQGATDPDVILGGLFASDNLGYPSEKIIRIADLFSDTLVSNGLPKGSKKSNFGDLITPKRGKTITKKQVISGEIPVIAGGRGPAYYHNVYNVCGPVVTISSSGANAGFVRLYNENIWASDCSFINRKQTDYLYLTYVFLKYQQDEIYRNQQGAVQPHVYPSDLERLKIVNLPLDVWKECENLINPLFMCISENQFQSQLLAKIRNLLLPRLISGEVRLKNNKNLT